MKNNLTTLLLILSAQVLCAQTFTSQNNRTQVWSDNATWVGGVVPNTSIVGTVNIYGDVTQPGNLTVSNSGGGATLNIYDTLTVAGAFTNSGTFNLAANGILNAASFDNTNSGGSTASVAGILNVAGSFNNANDLTILAGAVVTVDGNYTNANSGAAELDVYGTLIIKGNFSTATNIRVRPSGLLIILGDLTVTNAGAAEIINEGNTVVVGEVSSSGDITTGDQFYIFDDAPTYGWTANIDGTNWNGGNDNTLTSEFPTENDIPEDIWEILYGLGVGCAGGNTIIGAQVTCTNASVSLTGTALSGVAYLWESSTTSATTGFSTAAGTETNQHYTTAALTQTTWFRRRVTKTSPACTHYSEAIEVTVFSGSVWTGENNSNLNNAANWCGGVPTASTDAYFPAGKPRYPNAQSVSMKDVFVENGASITLANGQSMNLYGNFTNNGTLTFSNPTGTAVVTFQGSSQQTVTGGPYTFPNMTVNTGNNQVIFSSNVTVNRAFALTSGIVNMSGRSLTVGSGSNNATDAGTLPYTAGRVANGTLTRNVNTGSKTNFLFPMGTLTDNRPFSFSTTVNVGTGGTMSVTFTDATTATTGLNISDGGTIQLRHDSFWSISTSTNLGGTYTISAGGTGFAVTNTAHLRLMRAAGLIPGSTHLAATGSPGDFLARRSGVSLADLTGGPIYIGSIDASTTLPIRLLSFSGSVDENTVVLNWATASEENFSHFEVEQASDDLQFRVIGEVNGAGFSTKDVRHYSFTDTNPIIGTNYYRLKAVDLDDSFEYSPVIVSQIQAQKSFTIYPNPTAGNHVNIQVNFEPEVYDRIGITDVSGQEVANVVLESTVSHVSFPVALKPGVYVLTYYSQHYKGVQRLVVR